LRADLERAAERVALAARCSWWELTALDHGRWSLLLDGSSWADRSATPLRPLDGDLVVPLGEHPDAVARWDLRRSPHLLVAGATGSGKSSLLRTVVAALPLGWCWRVVVIDPKELDFTPARYAIEVVGLPRAPAILADLVGDLAHRKAKIVGAGADQWTAVPTGIVPIRPVLVVIDEAADVLGGSGLSKPEAQQVRDAVALLARQGRACGIHLVASFTRPDTEVVPGAVRDQFGARVGLGPMSPDGARMLFGPLRTPELSDLPPGTGLSLGLDGSQAIRRLRVPWVGIEAIHLRYGHQYG
jgi:DNA segregation ATPase FtsK/SpoIIIE-like protein